MYHIPIIITCVAQLHYISLSSTLDTYDIQQETVLVYSTENERNSAALDNIYSALMTDCITDGYLCCVHMQ